MVLICGIVNNGMLSLRRMHSVLRHEMLHVWFRFDQQQSEIALFGDG